MAIKPNRPVKKGQGITKREKLEAHEWDMEQTDRSRRGKQERAVPGSEPKLKGRMAAPKMTLERAMKEIDKGLRKGQMTFRKRIPEGMVPIKPKRKAKPKLKGRSV